MFFVSNFIYILHTGYGKRLLKSTLYLNSRSFYGPAILIKTLYNSLNFLYAASSESIGSFMLQMKQ